MFTVTVLQTWPLFTVSVTTADMVTVYSYYASIGDLATVYS